MKNFLALIAIAAWALIPIFALAQVSESQWRKEKTQLETQRAQVRVAIAEMQYRVAFDNYLLGRGSAKAAIDAAYDILIKGLAVGAGTHAADYETRIIDIERVAYRNQNGGTGIEGDVELANQARLDSILRRIMVVDNRE